MDRRDGTAAGFRGNRESREGLRASTAIGRTVGWNRANTRNYSCRHEKREGRSSDPCFFPDICCCVRINHESRAQCGQLHRRRKPWTHAISFELILIVILMTLFARCDVFRIIFFLLVSRWCNVAHIGLSIRFLCFPGRICGLIIDVVIVSSLWTSLWRPFAYKVAYLAKRSD